MVSYSKESTMSQDKMLGRIHGPQCDCNIEQYVSGKGEKCNHRYGVKRQRGREKQSFKRALSRDEL